MRVTVTDITGSSGTVTADRSEVAAAIRPWFTPDASPQVEEAIDRLQQSLDRAPADQLGTEDTELSTTRLCAYLGIELGRADADRLEDEAAIFGESMQESSDEIPSGSKPVEGVGTSTLGLGGARTGELPVVLIALLVVVSAIGSVFGLLLARKFEGKRRAARAAGARFTLRQPTG